ncbi:unnamed protein product [Prorocentrum cordatum]|uniref:EF-hand domain-containing protein n=1 Tax=Prorocentrum cordatum TaxID=2364126 RepID=A0ABN9VRY3_9DINO|nr:unnamed protein product [Polarella glacialis]
MMHSIRTQVTPLLLALLLCAPPSLKPHGALAAELSPAAAPGAAPQPLLRRLPSIPTASVAAISKGGLRRGRPPDPCRAAQLTAFRRGGSCGAGEAGASHNSAWCGDNLSALRCRESVEVPAAVCPSGRARLQSVVGDGTAAGQAEVGGCSYLFFSRYECDGGDSIAEAAMREAGPTFQDLDCVERDGVVTEDEAATWSVKNGVPYGEIRNIFDMFDEDGSRTLSEQEFERGQPLAGRVLAGLGAAFESVDRDGSGSVSRHEWLAYCSGWMTPRPPPQSCARLFDDALASGGGPGGELGRDGFEACGRMAAALQEGARAVPAA